VSIEIISRHPLNKNSWVRWVDPVRVFSTHELSRVGEVLANAEAEAQQGHHAIGFVAYEAGAAFDSRFHTKAGSSGTPLAWFAIFRGFEPCELSAGPGPDATWKPSVEPAEYRDKIARIKDRIARGETYQVNFTFPMASNEGPAIGSLFEQLCRIQPTPYAMMIDTEAFAIASVSPELFFRRDRAWIECQPMKGTCPRAPHPSMDAARGEQLRTSAKNRAENLMIVDMVRNDLGRIADPGTVRVDRLFEVSAWPTLWQMTSTITARTTRTLRDLFAALFPSASITGAPKLQTSSIIAELESSPRGIYTGAIGMIGPGQQATFAVAIRTVVHEKPRGVARYGIGSGIVWDSEADSEYAECLLKSKIISSSDHGRYDLLETMRWDPAEGIALEALHMQRMRQSAAYLGYPWHENEIKQTLQSFLTAASSAVPLMVRLRVEASGRILAESRKLEQPAHFGQPEEAPVIRAQVDSMRHGIESPFLYHKTTNRSVYEEARKRHPDTDEVLLVNDRGEAMEFTTGNIVVKRNGFYQTPPIDSGLLPGTFRQSLIEKGIIHESVIQIDSLHPSDAIFFINSVRGWRSVALAGKT